MVNSLELSDIIFQWVLYQITKIKEQLFVKEKSGRIERQKNVHLFFLMSIICAR